MFKNSSVTMLALLSAFVAVNAVTAKSAEAKWTEPDYLTYDEENHRCINQMTKKPIPYNKDKDGRDTNCSSFENFQGSLSEHFNKLKSQERTNLKGSSFVGVDIECGTDFSNFDLSYSNFQMATVDPSNSKDDCFVNMKEADLSYMDLRNVFFRGEVDMEDADLTGADLRGADLSGVENFDKLKSFDFRYDDKTIFPPGIAMSPDGELIVDKSSDAYVEAKIKAILKGKARQDKKDQIEEEKFAKDVNDAVDYVRAHGLDQKESLLKKVSDNSPVDAAKTH